MKALSLKSNNLRGIVKCPGDKSISQRSVIIGSLLDDDIKIDGFLFAEDPLSTLNSLKKLGRNIQINEDVISIKNSKKNNPSEKVKCNLGNSGTGFRLLSGLIAGEGISAELSGDDSLVKRPMNRIIKPLNEMGANIVSNNGLAPLHFSKSELVDEFNYEMPIASAQLKSCLLLAAISSKMNLSLHESSISRDHTERMLKFFGADIRTEKVDNGQNIFLKPGSKLQSKDYSIVGDFSSAAFLIIAALITKESQIIIRNVGINETRSSLISILKRMGANINIINREICCGEEVADIEVFSSQLIGVEIEEKDIPKIIDEIPILSIAASFADGETLITGASELRFKESDRLKAIEKGLDKIGIDYNSFEDGLLINGNSKHDLSEDTCIDSYGDHRIAMSFLIAGLRLNAKINVNDCKNIDTSFPNFFECFASIGAHIERI